MMTKIDGLAYELEGGQIMLEQDSGCGEVDRILIHPIHLRHLAECLGMLGAVSASDAERSRDLDRYKRALLLFRGRAEQLYRNICNLADQGREDMAMEVAQAAALTDLADHICIEFEDDFTATAPDGEAADVQPASAPDADKSRTTAGQKADKSKTRKARPEQQALTLERAQ